VAQAFQSRIRGSWGDFPVALFPERRDRNVPSTRRRGRPRHVRFMGRAHLQALDVSWGHEPKVRPRPRKAWIEHENEDEGGGRLGAGSWEASTIMRLRVGTMGLMDCGGKRSATPLSEWVTACQSGVAAALPASQSFDGAGCHRSPQGAGSWRAPCFRARAVQDLVRRQS